MPSYRINIQIGQSGANQTSESIKKIATSSDSASTSVDQLKKVLSNVSGSATSLGQIAQNANALRTAYSQTSQSVTSLGSAYNQTLQAANALNQVLPGISNANASIAQVSKNVDGLATAYSQALPPLDKLNQVITGVGVSTPGLNQSAKTVSSLGTTATQTTQNVNGLNQAVATAGGNSSGITQANQNIKNLGTTANQTSTVLDYFKKVLLTLVGFEAAKSVVGLSDTYQTLQNRLIATGVEAEQLIAVYDKLLTVANNTRSSFEGSVEIYSRLAVSAKNLGASQQQLIDFTQSLNQAITLSGTKSLEAEGALIQLSQGMASGVLQGDELRSVLEQLPAVADVIAAHFKVTRGELRKLGTAGKLTAQSILEAFKEAGPELNERFAKTIPTISSSFQVLKNQTLDYIGKLGQATGAANLLSSTILGLANNLDTVVKVLVSIGAGFAIILGGPAIFSLLKDAVIALSAAIAANPLGAFLIVLTSVVTAIALFKDQIKLGVDQVTTLGDLFRAFGQIISEAFEPLAESVKQPFVEIGEYISFFIDTTNFGLIDILKFAAKAVDGYVGLWIGGFKAIIVFFQGFPNAISDIAVEALNFLLDKISKFVNKAGELLSVVTEFAGLGKIPTANLEITNQQEGAAKKLGQDMGDAFRQGFDATNYANDFLDKLTTRAQQIAADRNKPKSEVDLTKGGDGKPPGLTDKELKKIKDDLNNLISAYDQVFAAQKEFADGIIILDKALAAGFLTSERRAQVIGLMTQQLRDSLDPLGAVNRKLTEELQLLKLTGGERQIETQLRSIQQDLISKGVNISEKELAQLKEKITLIQNETKASEARQQVLEGILKPQEDFVNQLNAINQLLSDGIITQGQATKYLVDQNQTLLAGTVEAQQAMVEQFQQTYEQIDDLRQADLISEQTAIQLKAQAEAELFAKKLEGSRNFFGQLANLSKSKNRELAAIGKAAAVTQATIDGVVAVQKALASAPPPANYALAAAVGITTAANVAQILAQNTEGFAFGGDFKVGGVGGTDSQLVSFRATPGESVSIKTPTQLNDEKRTSGNNGGGSDSSGNGVKIINVLDPALIGDYLGTDAGEKLVMNIVQRNQRSIN